MRLSRRASSALCASRGCCSWAAVLAAFALAFLLEDQYLFFGVGKKKNGGHILLLQLLHLPLKPLNVVTAGLLMPLVSGNDLVGRPDERPGPGPGDVGVERARVTRDDTIDFRLYPTCQLNFVKGQENTYGGEVLPRTRHRG